MNKKRALDVLELSSNDPSEDEIKKAYKRMSSRFHPDKEGGSTEKMQEINAARDFLLNPTESNYDFNYEKSSYRDDLYKRFFRGEDINLHIFLTIEEIANGCVKNVRNVGEIVFNKGEVTNGTVLILPGKGGKSTHKDAEDGDLIVRVSVKPNSKISLINQTDTVSSIDVPLEIAIYGGKIEVITPKGKFMMLVKENSGKTFQKRYKMTGKGIDYKGYTGDHYVELNCNIPNIHDFEEFISKRFDMSKE